MKKLIYILLLLPSAGLGQYIDLTSGLVSYFDCDNASGNITDSVGSNTLTTVSGVTYQQSGVNGYSIKFDGVNDYAYLTSASDINSLTGTLIFWTKENGTPTTAYAHFVNIVNGSYPEDGLQQFCNVTNDIIYSRVGDHPTYHCNANSGTTYGNTWRMIGVTWNSGTADAFYNDAQDYGSSTCNYSGGAMPTLNTIVFGKNYPAGLQYGNIYLDQIAIWNRVLTAEEIEAVYNSGSGRPLNEWSSIPVGNNIFFWHNF